MDFGENEAAWTFQSKCRRMGKSQDLALYTCKVELNATFASRGAKFNGERSHGFSKESVANPSGPWKIDLCENVIPSNLT